MAFGGMDAPVASNNNKPLDAVCIVISTPQWRHLTNRVAIG